MTLKQHAYNAILERILTGTLPPGELLNRRGMARQLAMSAAPVHEAMIQLEQEGFLEALPRLGTRVKTASRDNVRGHLVLREALECQAARMIGPEHIKSALPQLRSLAVAVDSSEASDSERARTEVEFHIALLEEAKCPELTREYRRIMQIGLFYRINLLLTMPSRTLVNRHEQLLENLLAATTPAEAEQCVRNHIWSGKPDFLKVDANQT
ncbi:MAG: GntR family transcriptional regulator [Candidatus Pacebacteria bacterium]|nr:GntR family transcriptional regulator [Candidatus Paceibacterota bacterium]